MLRLCSGAPARNEKASGNPNFRPIGQKLEIPKAAAYAMVLEHKRTEIRPTYSGVELAATESPGFEATRPITALALLGIEADYVPDEFTRTEAKE